MVFFTAPALPADVLALPALPHGTVATSPAPAPQGWQEYRVKGGDTLIGIAAIHQTTAEELAARNGITNPRSLQAGAVLLVPTSGALSGAAPTAPAPAVLAPVPAPAPASGEAAAPTGGTAYTVRSGDTAWAIERANGVTVPALLKANGLTTASLLQPGATLTIPGTTVAAPSATKPAPAPAAPQSPTGETSFPGIDGIPAVSPSIATNRALLATATLPSRMAVRDLIVATANEHGVDPQLALAIAQMESGWDQRHVSGVNAIGVMQVIPSAGDWASHLLGRDLQLMDTRDNITAGVVTLRALGRMAGSEEQAIAAYYQGLASVRAKGWYPDTQFYVRSVLALKSRV